MSGRKRTITNLDGVDRSVVGLVIKSNREARGMTQTELGERTGIHQPDVSAYERGEKTPSMETVKKIYKALGMI